MRRGAMGAATGEFGPGLGGDTSHREFTNGGTRFRTSPAKSITYVSDFLITSACASTSRHVAASGASGRS